MGEYKPLEEGRVIDFVLDEDVVEDGGQVKSYGDGRPAKGNDDLRVSLDPRHQIHGAFDGPQSTDDNASLLVLKFIPKPKNHEHKVLRLVIELRLLTPELEEDEDEDLLPEIVAFEPASQGVQFYGERVTDVTRQKGGKVTLTVPTPTPGPTIGGEGSTTTTKAFKWSDKLTVEADHEKVDAIINKKNLVRWTLKAASPDVGIGDSFTVAVLITRPSGSRFCLNFSSEGLLSSFAGTYNPFSFLKRKHHEPMGIYGPRPARQTVPEGVLENKLSAALKDGILLRETLKVGVHLPETAAPVAYYTEKAAAPPSTADAQSALETPLAPASLVVGDVKLAPDPVEASGMLPNTTLLPILAPNIPTIDTPDDTAPAVSVADVGPRKGSSLPASPAAANHRSHQNRPNNTRVKWTQQTVSGTDVRRAERHRMMAALYERLARLQREEAEDLLPPNEDEVAFVEDALRGEMGHGMNS